MRRRDFVALLLVAAAGESTKAQQGIYRVTLVGHSPTREIMNFGVTQEQLNGAQVSSPPIDERGLRST